MSHPHLLERYWSSLSISIRFAFKHEGFRSQSDSLCNVKWLWVWIRLSLDLLFNDLRSFFVSDTSTPTLFPIPCTHNKLANFLSTADILLYVAQSHMAVISHLHKSGVLLQMELTIMGHLKATDSKSNGYFCLNWAIFCVQEYLFLSDVHDFRSL